MQAAGCAPKEHTPPLRWQSSCSPSARRVPVSDPTLCGCGVALIPLSRVLNSVPKFISVETECSPDKPTADDGDALATLEGLCALRYKRFKLVDQRSVMVLTLNQEFYTRMYTRAWSMVRGSRPPWGGCGAYDQRSADTTTTPSPSLPPVQFGEDLEGVWIDAERAAETLVFHRRDYFASSFAQPYGFWCDWHAAQAD